MTDKKITTTAEAQRPGTQSEWWAYYARLNAYGTAEERQKKKSASRKVRGARDG